MILSACFAAQIQLDEREDLALVLIVPTGAMEKTSRSEIYQIISEILRDRSLYRLRAYDGNPEIDACRGNVGCLALAVRVGTSQPRFLIVFSVRPSETGDLLRLMLVDTEIVARIHERYPELSGDAFEDRIFTPAVLEQPPAFEIRASEDVSYGLRALIVDRLGPRIFGGSTTIAGTIEVTAQTEGIEIAIDGRAIGATRSGSTEIEGARPGTRTLSFTHPLLEPNETSVRVEPNSKVTVRVDERVRIEPVVETTRDVVFWTGAGTALFGASLMTYAFVHASTQPKLLLCLRSSENPRMCPPREYIEFGSVGGERFDELPGGGAPITPLALSLIATGATWLVFTWLGDQAAMPWLEIGLGLIAGIGTLAVTAALE